MAKKSIGLTSILMGPIALDGGIGLSLTQIGATVSDSAVMSTSAGTFTDFNIEEQDTPFYSIESQKGKTTVAWSTYDMDVDTLIRLFGGTKIAGIIGAVSSSIVTAPGTGYTSAPTVAFSGGGGTGAAGTAIISAGAVTGVTITNPGSGYTTAPTIALSGGAGTGATATSAISTTSDIYVAPDTTPEIEQSVVITTKDNWIISIVRAKINAVLTWNFQKTKLAQVAITATILTPTKSNTPAYKVSEP